MLQFLVGGGGWDEETVSVSSGQTAYYTRTGDGGVDDGDDIGELGLEDGVEVGRRCERSEAVAGVSGWSRLKRVQQSMAYELVSLEKTPISAEFSN